MRYLESLWPPGQGELRRVSYPQHLQIGMQAFPVSQGLCFETLKKREDDDSHRMPLCTRQAPQPKPRCTLSRRSPDIQEHTPSPLGEPQVITGTGTHFPSIRPWVETSGSRPFVFAYHSPFKTSPSSQVNKQTNKRTHEKLPMVSFNDLRV